MFEMQLAQMEKKKVLDQLKKGQMMVERGWSKHLEADQLLEEAQNQTIEADSLMKEYEFDTSKAREVQTSSIAEEVSSCFQLVALVAACARFFIYIT